MFGIPLTIYFLSSVFGFSIGLSGSEGHLWAVLMSRIGLLSLSDGVAVVMVVSAILIAGGLALLALGWRDIYAARGTLVTKGLYSKMRHPQYTGLILVVIAFLIQWPTVVTAAMFPVLIFAYYRLAFREEKELIQKFGQEFADYASRTPMFFPSFVPSRGKRPS